MPVATLRARPAGADWTVAVWSRRDAARVAQELWLAIQRLQDALAPLDPAAATPASLELWALAMRHTLDGDLPAQHPLRDLERRAMAEASRVTPALHALPGAAAHAELEQAAWRLRTLADDTMAVIEAAGRSWM